MPSIVAVAVPVWCGFQVARKIQARIGSLRHTVPVIEQFTGVSDLLAIVSRLLQISENCSPCSSSASARKSWSAPAYATAKLWTHISLYESGPRIYALSHARPPLRSHSGSRPIPISGTLKRQATAACAASCLAEGRLSAPGPKSKRA